MSDTMIEEKITTSEDILDVEKIRKDFPILKEEFSDTSGSKKKLVYLDNAATTQKPQQVINALRNYYEHQNANVHRAIHKLGERATQAYEESRVKVARFINAPSVNEVVFTRGTTESINLVAHAWGRKFLKEGDKITMMLHFAQDNLITLFQEFPAPGMRHQID